jgi:hypothetical protein
MDTSHANGLTIDQLRKFVPSVFATQAHESRSARFAPIPTINLIEGLMQNGWSVKSARQCHTRTPGKAPFTKHLVVMRRDDMSTGGLDSIPQLMLVNGNDGSAAYEMLAGLFRFLCANGLIVAGSVCESVKIRHTGNDIIGRVIEGSYRVLNDTQKAINSAREMSEIKLLPAEQVAFATAAARLRWDPETQPVNVQRLLDVRRDGDQGNDLWTTFNRVQESVIGGGQRYRVTGTGRRQRAREVKGIDQTVGLNQALWTLAEEMKALKAAA